MKKKNLLLGIVSAFVVSMAFMPNVYADEPKCTGIANDTELTAAINSCETITLAKDAKITTTAMIDVNNKNITLDLNGGSITRTNEEGNTVITVSNGGSLVIKDSVGTGKVVYSGKGSSITQALAIDGNGTLTVKGGTFIADTGVALWGDNGKLNFEGGTITATQNAISGNGAHSGNSTINISGGTIESTGGAVVYMPQSGTLNITNGNLTGYVGIVSRAGEVNLAGGTITTTGTDPVQIGDADVQFPGGVAVIVDNKTPGYTKGTGKAVISSGAKINATNENPVLAYENEENPSDEIQIKAGAVFTGTKPAEAYLGNLVVGPNNAVMTKAEAEKMEAELNNQDTSDDTTVDNSQASDDENVENPQTGDGIVAYIAMAIMSLISLVGLTTKKLLLIK